jgi:tetratricopeptide (TPR) repeat protein
MLLSFTPPAGETLALSVSELSHCTRELLTVATVLGDEFALDVLRSICGLDHRQVLDSLDEAQEAGFLEQHAEYSGRYRFRQNLVRQFLYQGLPSFRRIELHGQAADALESFDGRASNIAAEIADHLQKAWHQNPSNSNAEKNGEDVANSPITTRVNFLIRLGLSQARAGMFKASQATLSEAAGMAERGGDTLLIAKAAVSMPDQLLPLPGTRNPTASLLARNALSRGGNLKPDLRARLLARMAAEISYLGEAPERAEVLIAEALEIANECGTEVRLQVLMFRDLLLRTPSTVDQRIVNACAINELAGQLGDTAAAHFAFVSRATAHLERGEISRAESAWSDAAATAALGSRPDILLSISLGRASIAFGEGRLDDARTILEKLFENNGDGVQFEICDAMLALVYREQGAFSNAHGSALKALERRPASVAYRALVASSSFDLGSQSDARFYFERLSGECYRHLPDDALFLASGALLADLCVELGDVRRAEILYSLLLPYASHVIVMGHGMVLGPVSLHLGILTLFLGRHEAACKHLEAALSTSRSMGLRLWTVHTAYHLARCKDRPNKDLHDLHEKVPADSALQEVITEAEALGMLRLLRRAGSDSGVPQVTHTNLIVEPKMPIDEKSLLEVESMTTSFDGPKVETIQFYEEDETFVLRLSGRKVRMRRSKGLELMLMLIREPGREFHVTDLGRSNGCDAWHDERDATDGGPMLDAPAKLSYRMRLQDLREEREEAKKHNDPERVSRIEEEINFLARELARALGLKGTDRKAFSDSERARVRVTQAIRSTIRKIRKHDTVLGWYLEKAIRTGSFCSYTPPPSNPREI